MEEFYLKIYLFRPNRVPPIKIARNSQLKITIETMDYTVPEGATASAFAKGAFSDKVYTQSCTVDGNRISFTPQPGFFVQGRNSLQYEIGDSVIPLAIDVNCEISLPDGGVVVEPDVVKPYVLRAEAAAEKSEAAADRAQEVKDSIPEDYTELSGGVNQLKDEIVDLKNVTTIEKSTVETKDILSEVTITDNEYVDLNGNTYENYSYKHTNKISVIEGDTFTSTFGFRFVTAYKDNVAISPKGAEDIDSYVVPNGVDEVIFTVQGISYLKRTRTINYLENSCLEQMNRNTEDILNIEEDILNLEEQLQSEVASLNLANYSTFVTGIIDGSGTIYPESTAYFTTDFIHLKKDETISFTTSRRYYVVDESKTQRIDYKDGDSNTYTATENCYIKLSGYSQNRRQFMCNYGTTLYEFTSYKETIKVRKVLFIYAEEGINKFYEKMLSAYNAGNIDVYISKGDYTYTNELIDNIRNEGRRGIPIGNGCRYYFETGAILYCEYTGSNSSDVAEYFSPLDSMSIGTDYEIHNLNLTSKNTCYALHDESNGELQYCKHSYYNCSITLDNTALGKNGNILSKAIGGGLGSHTEIIIENCVFHTTNLKANVKEDVSYHGGNGKDFTDARIFVNGCWFENTFRSSFSFAEDKVKPYIVFNNNCVGLPYNLNGSTYYDWNNDVRS